jgi:predicted GH43/DUF377 family glycosyl hydrolase
LNWRKIKHLFVADQQSDWMHSHASNAVFSPYDQSTGRIYFTCRDQQGKSHIASIDIDFENNFSLFNLTKQPILSPGQLGTFDDSGVVMACLQKVKEKTHLYYLGWNLKVTVPWLNTIGLAIKNDHTGEFEKFSQAPIMDRSHEDPFTISYPHIIFEDGIYRMWYGSNLSWGKDQREMQHVFKYAESVDGIKWYRSNQIVLNLEHPNEYALSKPWVVKTNGSYEMWYSYRACRDIETYRIGYATSSDGLNWVRKDHLAGIDVSEQGWDSEMISYSCVFSFNGKTYMLYNGNGYGKTGFGIAVLEEAATK